MWYFLFQALNLHSIILLRWLVCHCSPNQEREKKKCFPSWKKRAQFSTGVGGVQGLVWGSWEQDMKQTTSCEICNAKELHDNSFWLWHLRPHYLCWHSQSVALWVTRACLHRFVVTDYHRTNPTSGPFILQHLLLLKGATFFFFVSFSMFFSLIKNLGKLLQQKTSHCFAAGNRRFGPKSQEKLPPIHTAPRKFSAVVWPNGVWLVECHCHRAGG